MDHRHEYEYGENDEEEDSKVPGVPAWFTLECKLNKSDLYIRYSGDLLDRPKHIIAAQLPVQESWARFREWRRQQQDVISTGADVAALRHGLARFPTLHTISITPSVHGYNLAFPLYDTPTIRSFPPGFNYPLPHGWPITGEREPMVDTLPWTDEDGGSEEQRDTYRGFRIVLRELAQHAAHRVSELIVDSHELDTGLNCHIFDRLSPEYDHFVSLLCRPGFRRLNLSLSVGGQEVDGWTAFRSTLLKRALSETGPDLQHVSLTTDIDARFGNWTLTTPAGGRMAHHIPLLTVFPVDRWPNLHHFGLAGFLVTQDDLLSLLAALPPTLRSLQLGKLYFVDEAEHWRGLLEEIRDRLGWRERPARERPRVVMFDFADTFRQPGRAVWVDAEVAEFLYGDGPNPFGDEDGRLPSRICMGRAGTVRDAFDPGYERPYVCDFDLMRLGYIKKDPRFFPEAENTSLP
jgi:hypothetical protein